MDRHCPTCSTVIRYPSGSQLALGACPACSTLMLFPATSGAGASAPPKKLRDYTKPQPVILDPGAPNHHLLWKALATLGIGIILAAVISVIYTTGLIRMLGIETPVLRTPAIFPHFGVVSLIFTAGIVWMAFPTRGKLGRACAYLVSGIAPGMTLSHGIRLLRRYRETLKLHRQIA